VADGKCYIDFILLVWTIFFFREQVRACVSLRGKIIIISHTNLAHTRKLKQEKQEKQQQQPPRLAWKPIESKLPTPTPAGDPTSLNNLQPSSTMNPASLTAWNLMLKTRWLLSFQRDHATSSTRVSKPRRWSLCTCLRRSNHHWAIKIINYGQNVKKEN
jgi:hypothetical protein